MFYENIVVQLVLIFLSIIFFKTNLSLIKRDFKYCENEMDKAQISLIKNNVPFSNVLIILFLMLVFLFLYLIIGSYAIKDIIPLFKYITTITCFIRILSLIVEIFYTIKGIYDMKIFILQKIQIVLVVLSNLVIGSVLILKIFKVL